MKSKLWMWHELEQNIARASTLSLTSILFSLWSQPVSAKQSYKFSKNDLILKRGIREWERRSKSASFWYDHLEPLSREDLGMPLHIKKCSCLDLLLHDNVWGGDLICYAMQFIRGENRCSLHVSNTFTVFPLYFESQILLEKTVSSEHFHCLGLWCRPQNILTYECIEYIETHFSAMELLTS